jgi:hypothetical protein
MAIEHNIDSETEESRFAALDLIKNFLAVSPNTLKQGLSGEEFATELAKGAEILIKYLKKGVIS